MTALLISALLALGAPATAQSSRDAFRAAEQARAAYARGDMPGFLRSSEEAARLRPGDVWMLYNLACAQARNGLKDAAVETLRRIVDHRVAGDLAADTDFESIRGEPGYVEAVARIAALRKERVTSGATPAFTIPQKGLVPEGVAFDPVTKSFFVSSIRRREIFRIGPDGKAAVFVTEARDGLRAAAGLAVDAKRRTLWVASQAMPHMVGARKDEPPASAVFEYDVDSGRLRREHRPPETLTPPPAFDDLTVAPDGRVYVNDGRTPRIFTLEPSTAAAPATHRLEVFLESDALRGTQGLAVTPDGKTIYASDYSGLARIDAATRAVVPIHAPSDLALNGIDGLVYYSGSLVGIQNGVSPHRVIRLDLAPDGVSIERARILEMNHPAFDEPTLGVVVDGALYFTANSQGGKFLDEKHPIEEADMREAVILKLPLESRHP